MSDERAVPDESAALSRRELIKAGTAIAVASTALSAGALAACGGDAKTRGAEDRAGLALSPDEERLLEEVADTILPTTPSSPGAKAAGVGAIANLLLTDCYDEGARARVRDGLQALEARVEGDHGGPWIKLSPSQRERLLLAVDDEAKREGEKHWFHLVRELSTRAYFASETGMTKALRYVRVPGRWDGCVPLEPGQPAWG